MKKVFGILIAVLVMTACKQKIEPTDVAQINGYWEIEKVVFKDGYEKKYGVNESFDYFRMDKNNTGIRKKVMPQLDGTFLVDNTFEKVKVRFTKDQTFLDYTTPYMKWSEEVLTLTPTELVVLNSEEKEYHYKKTGQIKLDDYGKKTK
jgi:hypothetical protein